MTRTPSPKPALAVTPARIVWRDGIPESADFGDVYFSRDNGLEETRYVFLEHNQLPRRFSNIRSGEHFVIAESGFGTGLNFLAAWQCWRDAQPPEDAVLHFVSVERYPLTPEDLRKAHAAWPELAGLAEQLQACYPALVGGSHRLHLDNGKVRLTLYFGDALDGWEELDFTANAWFLDGFAPALNPELWVDGAVAAVQRHSRAGTTVATFTSVGRVRRALIAAGFTMHKVAGYGRKREMLTGTFKPEAETTPGSPVKNEDASVVVIGAGIAGALLARNLADRGVRVTVIEGGQGAGSGASGNQQGALYVKLGIDYSPQTQLALSALLYSQRYYRRFQGTAWFPTGVLQLAHNGAEAERQSKFLARNTYPNTIVRPVSAVEGSRLSNTPLDKPALWFPDSGWLKPATLCRELLNHALIEFLPATRVTKVAANGEHWEIHMADGNTIVGQHVVLCTGHRVADLLPQGRYRFKPIRGQVTQVPKEALHAPSCVICGNRYLNPPDQGTCLTGATFDLKSSDPELSRESQTENLSQLEGMVPGIYREAAHLPAQLTGRVAFRCTTHDYQPVAGTVALNETAPARRAYLLTGLGSKGLSYAPLLAEYLADCITGQPAALPAHCNTVFALSAAKSSLRNNE